MQPVDTRVVELLNEALTFELTVTNTYFLNARMLDNWGFPTLGKVFYDLSIEEMKDADGLIQRILLFEGHPNVQKLNKVNVGQTVPEQMRLDLDLEKGAIKRLNAGIETCRALGDNGSRELLEDILEGEEEHANWIEAQLALIAQVGESNYLAQQIIES